jgi:hypothetical protein
MITRAVNDESAQIPRINIMSLSATKPNPSQTWNRTSIKKAIDWFSSRKQQRPRSTVRDRYSPYVIHISVHVTIKTGGSRLRNEPQYAILPPDLGKLTNISLQSPAVRHRNDAEKKLEGGNPISQLKSHKMGAGSSKPEASTGSKHIFERYAFALWDQLSR